MIEVEIELPLHFRTEAVPEMVQRVCSSGALTCTMKGTLAGYPGCVHWHLKKGKETGTLEITWWAQRKRLWFKMATGRAGSWIEETIVRIKHQIELELQDEIRLEAVTKSESPLLDQGSRQVAETMDR